MMFQKTIVLFALVFAAGISAASAAAAAKMPAVPKVGDDCSKQGLNACSSDSTQILICNYNLKPHLTWVAHANCSSVDLVCQINNLGSAICGVNQKTTKRTTTTKTSSTSTKTSTTSSTVSPTPTPILPSSGGNCTTQGVNACSKDSSLILICNYNLKPFLQWVPNANCSAVGLKCQINSLKSAICNIA